MMFSNSICVLTLFSSSSNCWIIIHHVRIYHIFYSFTIWWPSVIFILWLLWIILWWTFVCKFFGHKFSFILNIYQGTGLLGNMVTLLTCLLFSCVIWRNVYWVPLSFEKLGYCIFLIKLKGTWANSFIRYRICKPIFPLCGLFFFTFSVLLLSVEKL